MWHKSAQPPSLERAHLSLHLFSPLSPGHNLWTILPLPLILVILASSRPHLQTCSHVRPLAASDTASPADVALPPVLHQQPSQTILICFSTLCHLAFIPCSTGHALSKGANEANFRSTGSFPVLPLDGTHNAADSFPLLSLPSLWSLFSWLCWFSFLYLNIMDYSRFWLNSGHSYPCWWLQWSSTLWYLQKEHFSWTIPACPSFLYFDYIPGLSSGVLPAEAQQKMESTFFSVPKPLLSLLSWSMISPSTGSSKLEILESSLSTPLFSFLTSNYVKSPMNLTWLLLHLIPTLQSSSMRTWHIFSRLQHFGN